MYFTGFYYSSRLNGDQNVPRKRFSFIKPSLGEGAVSIVRKGHHEGQMVAVKQCRVAGRSLQSDDVNFS